LKSAVVLLSGGLDSATVLAIAAHEGFNCFALSFDYGQRHQRELLAAAEIARSMAVARHIILKLDLRQFGGSALTADIPVPKDRNTGDLAEHIPVTYVPARNTIFLACALGWAEVLQAEAIFVGVNALDYSGYPDCRPEFISAFENLANVATKAATADHRPIRLRAPLIQMGKDEIISAGLKLGVDYSKTFSCYDPPDESHSCGHCDACQLRLAAFAKLHQTDPIAYV
jgi:7-cyano-7-deazaguanine synthase